MRHLKIIIPIALLLTFALSLYIGSHVIAQTECQFTPFSKISENPAFPPGWECFYYDYNPSTPFEYDYTQSGVTIAPGGMTDIYLIGGEPLYIWDNPGYGYSWESGTTTYIPFNTLVCTAGT